MKGEVRLVEHKLEQPRVLAVAAAMGISRKTGPKTLPSSPCKR